MSNIIAFIGERKSGKDFFIDHLAAKYGVKRLSFSDEVRRISSFVFNWLPSEITPEEKDVPFVHPMNPNNYTPRQIWLMVGKMRDVEPHLFVRKFEFHNEIATIHRDPKLHIISDFRTPQEFAYIKKHNIKVIKLNLFDRTGIEPCAFEQYVRDFTDYDAHFVNHKNGTADFDVFFERFIWEQDLRVS